MLPSTRSDMPSFRDIKNRARQDLHKILATDVLYLAERLAEPQPLSVRIHDTITALGALGGDSDGFAERYETTPFIRFMQFCPVNKAVVVTEDPGVLYMIVRVKPAHGLTTDADVVKLTVNQIRYEELDPTQPWGGLPAPVRRP